MNISVFEPFLDLDNVRAMLSGNEDVWRVFQKFSEKLSEVTYIARVENKIAGFLSIRKTSSISVELAFYVAQPHQRKGIGSELMRHADRFVADSTYEHALCNFTADESVAQFLVKNGFRRYCAEFDMERDGSLINPEELNDDALKNKNILIRNYRDEDYMGYHNVSDLAFYLLREKLGLMPQYYQPPCEEERSRLARIAANRYVMLDNDVLAAIGAVTNDRIHLLAVRPDLQGRGYGRMMASYLNNLLITQRKAEKVTIGLVEGNPAKRLYESLGFRDIGYSYQYIKCYKPDSRPKAPEGYGDRDEILRDLRLYGGLREGCM